MSSFKKNRSLPKVTDDGKKIINQAEDITYSANQITKEITIPFTQEMTDLLEKIFLHFDGDISRRKLCSKYLLKALRAEAKKIDIE